MLKFYVIADKDEGLFFIRTNPLMLSSISKAEIQGMGGSYDAQFQLLVNKAVDFAYEFNNQPDQSKRDQVRAFKDYLSGGLPETIKLCFSSEMQETDYATYRRATTYSDINSELKKLDITGTPSAAVASSNLRKQVEGDSES